MSFERWSAELDDIVAVSHRTVLQTRELIARLKSARREEALIERSRQAMREAALALQRVERTIRPHTS